MEIIELKDSNNKNVKLTNRLNSQVQMTEDKINKFENRSIKFTQHE